ncbi:MAG: virulence factor [Flavobacteriaceae bacterium]
MAECIIVYWRDIPAQVTVQSGRKRARRELSKRFIEAIDMAAMRVGARDSEAYLAEWRRGAPEACDDDLEAEADKALAELEAAYDDARLKALVAAGGRES